MAYCQAAAPEQEASQVAAGVLAAFRRRVIAADDAHALDPDALLIESARELACATGATDQRLDAAAAAYRATGARRLSDEDVLAMLRGAAEAAPVTAQGADSEAVVQSARRLYAYHAPATTGITDRPHTTAQPDSRWLPAPGPPGAGELSSGPATVSNGRAPTPRSVRGRPRWAVSAGGSLAILAAIAAVGVVILIASDETDHELEPAGRAIRSQQPRTPFDADGVRLEVVPTSGAGWAAEIREETPDTGRRWITVAVRLRNVSREGFRPGSLGYRVRVEEPFLAATSVGPRIVEAPGRVAVGDRGSAHLGFQVSEDATGLELMLDSRGSSNAEIRVPL